MAAANVTVSAATSEGAQLLNAINQLQTALDQIRKIKLWFDQQQDGGGVFTTIEARVGLVAGNGVTCYNLVAGALTELTTPATTPNCQGLLSRINQL